MQEPQENDYMLFCLGMYQVVCMTSLKDNKLLEAKGQGHVPSRDTAK